MTFIVDCDKCEYQERTKSYERAKDLQKEHRLLGGHLPEIRETGV